MNLGHVIGSIWATRKDPSIEGKRMLLVQPLFADGSPKGRPLAALDTADAGPGDRVLYVTSAEAALPFRPPQDLTASDATIVGVVDRVDIG
ncbi:MAG: EutN/CcmL family microcompartment protein [Rhodothermaceae bacterium]|nr:EutN/CcmL family microcompartment protein [Rhodothermaceae bacterium]